MRATVALALLLVGCGGPPSWPDGAELSVEEVSASHLAFGWPEVDGADVAAYVVRIDGEDVARLDPHVRTYGADELAEATEHRVEVVAVAEDGTESVALSTRATTADGTAPAFAAGDDGLIGDRSPITVRVEETDDEDGASRTVHLSWPAATDTVGVTRYRVLRDGEEVASVDAPATELTLSDVRWDEATEIAVRALDAAGNESDPGLTTRWTPALEVEEPSDAQAPDPADERRARIEAATAQAEQLLLGALSADGDHRLADVLSSGAVPGNAEDVMARAEGVGVASNPGTLRTRGGGGRVGGLGGLSARPAGPRSTARLASVSNDPSRPALSAILRRGLTRVRRCHETALRSAPGLAGAITVQLQIRPDGSVGSSRVTDDVVGSGVAACVATGLRSMRFGAGEAATVDARFVLAPRE